MKKGKRMLQRILAGVLFMVFAVLAMPALRVEAKTPTGNAFNAEIYGKNSAGENIQYMFLTKGNKTFYEDGRGKKAKAVVVIYGRGGCNECKQVLKDAYDVYKAGGSLKILYVMAFRNDDKSEIEKLYPNTNNVVECVAWHQKNEDFAWKTANAQELVHSSNLNMPLTMIVKNDDNRYVTYISAGIDSGFKSTLTSLAGGGSSGGGGGGGGSSSQTGAWYQSGNKWKFKRNGKFVTNNWAQVDGKWYHFDAQGYMQTGWIKLNNKWYFLKSSGAMATGWTKVSGKWFYMNSSGVMQTGWVKVGGKWYYMNKNGVMQTGWQRISGIWYYLNADGSMAMGWLKSGGNWYYLDSKGMMLANTSRNINGKVYFFKSDGVCRNK